MKDLDRGVTPENFYIATRRNMERWAHLLPIAYSPSTGTENSANSGDYFMLGMDDPLTDEDGEELVLVVKRTEYIPVDEVGVTQ